MSEPTVKIPARLGIRMARYVYHYAKLLGMADKKAEESLTTMVDELGTLVANQCTDKELNEAFVAVTLEESK